MQLGPFEVMKLVGVDLVVKIAWRLSAAYGERFRLDDLAEGAESIHIEKWLESDPERYDAETRGGNTCDGDEQRRSQDAPIVDQIILPLIQEALACLREGVASADDLELAAVECLRMPIGPLALARKRGIAGPETLAEGPAAGEGPAPTDTLAAFPNRRPVAAREPMASKGVPSSSSLDVQIERQVAILTLNNPPANSLTIRLLGDFLQLLDRAELDGVRAVVIVGAGRVFSTGVDPTELGTLRSAEEGRLRSRQGQELLSRIERASTPVIAAINGLCLGGGLELALACHIRFCGDRARLGLPEVQLGIIPGLGGTQRLPRLVGLSRALDLILTGETIGAERAFQIGLVDRIVSRKDVLEEAVALARRLAGRDPSVVDAVLRTVRDGMELPIEAGLELEAKAFGRLAGTRAGRQAKRARPDSAVAAVAVHREMRSLISAAG